MARKRMIDPAIWTDKETMALSDSALIVWIGLISHADDEGIVEVNTESLYWRLARRSITPDQIAACLGELKAKHIVVYDENYAFIPTWFKHQSLNRPSLTRLRRPPAEMVRRFPEYIAGWQRCFSTPTCPAQYPFREAAPETQRADADVSTDDQQPLMEPSLRTHGALTEDSVRTHGALTLKGKERKGREVGAATRAADRPPPEPEPVDNSSLQLLGEGSDPVPQRRNGRHARASPFEHEIMAFFEAHQPITNYPAAWKAVHGLVGKARALARDGPEEALKAIVGAFLALTRGEFPAPLAASDLRWWRGKAFSPQMLSAVFDQVAALMRSVQAEENPEGLEAARRAFAKWRPG